MDETRSGASVLDETRSGASVFIPGFVSAGNVAFFVSAGNVADASTAAGSFFLQKEACSALDPVFSHLHRLPSSGENLGFSSSGEPSTARGAEPDRFAFADAQREVNSKGLR